MQDVSSLSDRLGELRLDFPVLVRYDRANPADSIVVSEEWTGLRSGSAKPHRNQRQTD